MQIIVLFNLGSPHDSELSAFIVNVRAFEPNVRMDTALQIPLELRGWHVIPAAKRILPYDHSLACKQVSLKDMFEAPKPNRRKRHEYEYSDESSSDDIFQS